MPNLSSTTEGFLHIRSHTLCCFFAGHNTTSSSRRTHAPCQPGVEGCTGIGFSKRGHSSTEVHAHGRDVQDVEPKKSLPAATLSCWGTRMNGELVAPQSLGGKVGGDCKGVSRQSVVTSNDGKSGRQACVWGGWDGYFWGPKIQTIHPKCQHIPV